MWSEAFGSDRALNYRDEKPLSEAEQTQANRFERFKAEFPIVQKRDNKYFVLGRTIAEAESHGFSVRQTEKQTFDGLEVVTSVFIDNEFCRCRSNLRTDGHPQEGVLLPEWELVFKPLK